LPRWRVENDRREIAPILEFQKSISWAPNGNNRRSTGSFEDRAMYPTKMAALVFGHAMFVEVFIWVFH
jgi:hypothetical protein